MKNKKGTLLRIGIQLASSLGVCAFLPYLMWFGYGQIRNIAFRGKAFSFDQLMPLATVLMIGSLILSVFWSGKLTRRFPISTGLAFLALLSGVVFSIMIILSSLSGSNYNQFLMIISLGPLVVAVWNVLRILKELKEAKLLSS
jgi:ABC-type transport system involved in cytochrome c biogenesis permease subunit